MNYNRIDVLDPGGTGDQGVIWQGGSVDDSIDQAPFTDPILIVCMDRGESNEQWINHSNVEAVLAVWIEDDPSACLSDKVLTSLANTLVGWLHTGGNIYVHCAAGVSRASYMDIAIHCIALHLSANDALALIRQYRPIANPNSGFLAQLQRLWP